MKTFTRLFVLSLLFFQWAHFAQAQTTLAQESFESPAGDYGFTANFAGACNDLWNRVTVNPGCFINNLDATADGNAWVAGEDIDGVIPGGEGVVTLNSAAVTGFSSLDVQVALGVGQPQGGQRWDENDRIFVEYNMDGGGWNIIGLFQGNATAAAGSGDLAIETDNDPSDFGPHGALVPESMTDYTFSIPVTGSSVQVRVRALIDGGSEEIGVDNIRVRGVVSANMAPVLANIEGSTINYTEGDPATQVTNTITVSDGDDTQLTGGTVTISSGFDASEDVLAATGLPGGITASYTAPTLSLIGTASLANYQTALRAVTYQNTDASNPSTATRTVRFQVTDGTDNSNFQSRNISISTVVNPPTALPICESFETDGEGTRYTSNTFESGCDLFIRSSGTPGCFDNTITGIDGSFIWASEDVTGGIGVPGTVQLSPLIATGNADFTIDILLGISPDNNPGGSGWEIADNVLIQYNMDGSSWVTVGAFYGTNPTTGTTQGMLVEDADLNGVADPGGIALTAALQNFTYNFNATGTNLNVRVVVDQAGGSEELAFDNICVSGQAGQMAPILANIEGSILGFPEGGPPLQVTNTLTVTDGDDTNLETATVSVCGNYVNGEDVLAFTSFGGITGSFVAATGVLSLSGTASLADYQSTLRSVTYQNTNAVNPSTAVRTVCFQVNDGDANSNTQSRLINIEILLNAPECLPFTESFESDGEGTTYGSNTFNDQPGNCDFFYRTNVQPGCHSQAITGIDGSFFWASEDVRGGSNGNVPGIVTLQPLIATNFTGISVTVALAVSGSGMIWELDDFIRIQYEMDGGGFITVGQFVGDAAFGGALRQDTNLDGSADGATLTSALTDYAFNIPVTGNNLQVRIVVDQLGGTEEFAFDNLRVDGTLTGGTATVVCPTDPPTIEGCTTADVQPTSNLAFSTSVVTITEAQFEAEGGDITPDGSASSITYQDMSTGVGVHPIIVTRTFTIESGCNNTDVCMQTFTIQDTTPPTIPTCPQNVTVEGCGTDDLDADGTVEVPFNTALTGVSSNQFQSEGGVWSDNCTPQRSITHQDVAAGSFPTIVTRTWTVTDFGFNTVQCTQTITIADSEVPTINCPTDITVDNDQGQCGATVNFSPTSNDNCPGVTASCVPMGGSFFAVGTTSVTCTATDASGNMANCSFNVTVNDAEDPTINCPADITVDNDQGQCGATVNFSPTSNDNCPGVTASCVPMGGSFFAIGTTPVTCTATDASGNMANCSFNVTVNDAEPPTIPTCPPMLTVEGCSPNDVDADGQTALSFNPGPSQALISSNQFSTEGGTWDDNCMPQQMIQYIDVAGGACPVMLTRTFTVTDQGGNTVQCQQQIEIDDTTPPMITCPGLGQPQPPIPLPETEPNNMATDPGVIIISQPANLLGTVGMGDEFDFWNIPDGSFGELTISHNINPGLPVIAAIECYADAARTILGPVVSAIPGGPSATMTLDPFLFYSVKVNLPFALSPYDVLVDGPALSSPPPIEWPAGFNTNPVGPNTPQDTSIDPSTTGMPMVSDNCSTNQPTYQDVIAGPNQGSCPVLWTVTRTWTATDDCGNMATCDQVFVFEDTTAPDFVAQECSFHNASDPDFDDQWQNGDAAGTPGFSAGWTLLSGPNSGHFVASSTENGNGDANGDGDIDSGGRALGLFANSGNFSDAVIALDMPMVPGSKLSLQFDNGFVDPNQTVGIGLLNSSNELLWEFLFIGGVPEYIVNDGTGSVNTGLAFSDEGFDIEIVQLDLVSIAPIVISLDGGATYSAASAPTVTQPGGQQIAKIRVFNANAGFDAARNVYVNNFMVCHPDPAGTCAPDLTFEWQDGFNQGTVGPNTPQDPTIDPLLTGTPWPEDNCAIADISYQDVLDGPNPGNCPDLWTVTRTWTATDFCNNSNTCVQTFTFQDTTPPEANCFQMVTLNLNSDGTGTLDANFVGQGSTDNCGVPTLSLSQSVFDCSDVGVQTVNLIATDLCGNTDICPFTLTVVSPIQINGTVTHQQGPVIADGAIDITPFQGTAPYTFSWSNGATTEDISGLVGLMTYTVDVTDANGCMAQASFFVDQGDLVPIDYCIDVYLFGLFDPLVQSPGPPLRTTLNDQDLLPLMQPFDDPAFGYMGTESFPSQAAIPPEVSDWVLLRFRGSADPSVIAAEVAVVVLNSGAIVAVDGGLPRVFLDPADDYYIEVLHQNHLPISSALPQPVNPLGGNWCYDFTTAMTQAFRDIVLDDDPMQIMPSINGTVFGMVSGNAMNQDCQIDTAGDINLVFLHYLENLIYASWDINRDGQVDVNDINMLFFNFNRNGHKPY